MRGKAEPASAHKHRRPRAPKDAALDALSEAVEIAIGERSARREGRETRFVCAAHDDQHPSARWNPTKRCWHCDACGAGGGVLDLAQRLDIKLPQRERPARAQAPPRRPTKKAKNTPVPVTAAKKCAQITRLWRDAVADDGTIATYFKSRGLNGTVPSALRLHRTLRYYEQREGEARPACLGTFPAMVAEVQTLAGEVVARHRTYLRSDGGGKADVADPKKLTKAIRDGATRGAAIRLAEPVDGRLALTEGIETAIAVMQATGISTWACVSAGGLAAIELPEGVRAVELWADHDTAGIKAAADAARRLHVGGRTVRIMIPERKGTDWLDLLVSDGAEELRQARAAAQLWTPSAEDDADTELARARTVVATLSKKVKADPGAAFEPAALKALMLVRSGDEPLWARTRQALKNTVSLRDLDRALARTEVSRRLEAARGTESNQPHPYRATDGGLVYLKNTPDGNVEVPLTNFSATIVADVQHDDGVEITRAFELEATLRGRHARFTTPASRFATMTWPIEHLGAEAVVYPGSTTRDRARVAVQLLSDTVPTRVVYTHTGWRRFGDVYVYLHAGGAIGATGLVSGIEVDLAGKLARYRLPAPPADAARTNAVRASLDLLHLGPHTTTIPAVACAYLAPLCTLLDAIRPDFVAWLVGGSGVFKSELAALVQAHYGEFTRLTLPASFEATANSVERMLFTAKDAVLVVDDYHPAGDLRQAQAMAAIASRLLRGVGNGTGRSRMRSDTTLRGDLPPRALALATGERLPTGHSNLARLFAVPFGPPGIDVERLTAAQGNAHLLPLAMAAYLQWIAINWEPLARDLPSRFEQLRTTAQRADGHRREPGQVAILYLAVDTFSRFAVDVDAIDSTAATKLLHEAWEALRGVAAAQATQLAEETPVRRFLALLADGFASRRIYVEAVRGGAPQNPERWGWERRTGEGNRDQYTHGPAALLVGKLIDDSLCLYPEVTHQYVTMAARAADQVFPVELRTLLKNLADEGFIAAQSGRHTVKVRLGKDATTGSDITPRVIKLRVSALSPPSGNREQGEHEEAPSDPEELIIR